MNQNFLKFFCLNALKTLANFIIQLVKTFISNSIKKRKANGRRKSRNKTFAYPKTIYEAQKKFMLKSSGGRKKIKYAM